MYFTFWVEKKKRESNTIQLKRVTSCGARTQTPVHGRWRGRDTAPSCNPRSSRGRVRARGQPPPVGAPGEDSKSHDRLRAALHRLRPPLYEAREYFSPAETARLMHFRPEVKIYHRDGR